MGRCIWFFSVYAFNNKNYAIDYNYDNYIDLKNSHDAYASAANYLNKIGWKKIHLVFIK